MVSVRWVDVINFQLASTIMGLAALSAHKEWLAKKIVSVRKSVTDRTAWRSRRRRAAVLAHPSSSGSSPA